MNFFKCLLARIFPRPYVMSLRSPRSSSSCLLRSSVRQSLPFFGGVLHTPYSPLFMFIIAFELLLLSSAFERWPCTNISAHDAFRPSRLVIDMGGQACV